MSENEQEPIADEVQGTARAALGGGPVSAAGPKRPVLKVTEKGNDGGPRIVGNIVNPETLDQIEVGAEYTLRRNG
jgi:hypothetical protein